MEQQCPVDHLTELQAARVQTGDPALALQDQPAFPLLLAPLKDGVHYTGKALPPQGLELIKIRFYRVGLHSELGGRG